MIQREPAAARRDGAALDTADDLQELVERLSELIGNPLTVETPDFRLLAYSRHPHRADPAREQTILNKRVPEPIVRALAASGVMAGVNASPHPVRVRGIPEVGLGDRVVMPVRVGAAVRAHIWVQETERPLGPDELRILEQAAALVAVQLLRLEQQREARQRMVADFLWELLAAGRGDAGSGPLDPDSARQRAERLGVALPEPFRVILAEIDAFRRRVVDGRQASEGDIDALKRRLLQLIQGEALRLGRTALTLPFSDSVIVVASTAERDPPRGRSLCRAIHEAAAAAGFPLTVAASRVRRALQELPDAYREAQRCLAAARALGLRNRVVASEDLGVLQHLPDLAALQAGSGARHRAVEAVLAHEGALNFPLAETLEAYLDCGGDAQAAAERLCVHVNTLHYRLRRIAEATGLDLDDGLQRLAVHLELKLRRLHPG